MKKSINLSVPNLDVEPILCNLRECIESGWVSTGGRFISEFEGKVAKYTKSERAVGVQSGTAGVHLALNVLGITSENEVLVPTLTFIAAVNPVTYLGATPVFIGCDDTLCIDPNLLEKFLEEECILKNGITYNKKTLKKISALILVHVFGNMSDMERIMEIASRFNLKVIEDATEALGTYYTEGKYAGKYAGTIGDIGIYSFNANKIITTGGGGMILSKNHDLLDKIRSLSTQAKKDELYFLHDEIGYNYRMLNLQAAIGTTQIDTLENFIETKTKNYKRYKEAISEIDGLEMLDFNIKTRPNYWFYSIVVDEKVYGINKDQLLRALNNHGIQTRPIWGLIHEQKPYEKNQVYSPEKAIWYHDRVLNIPCSSNLGDDDIQTVINLLKSLKKK